MCRYLLCTSRNLYALLRKSLLQRTLFRSALDKSEPLMPETYENPTNKVNLKKQPNNKTHFTSFESSLFSVFVNRLGDLKYLMQCNDQRYIQFFIQPWLNLI